MTQNKMHVEQYSRQPDSTWLFSEFKRASAHFILTAIHCKPALEDIYEKVALEQPRLLNGQSHQE